VVSTNAISHSENTQTLVEVIDGWNISLKPIKALEVTIALYISKIIFDVISSLETPSSLGQFDLLCIIYKWIGIQRIFILNHQSMRP
jgi:hypothetical protein